MIPWHPAVTIIEYQNSVWAVCKPCGVLSHPNRFGEIEKSVVQAPYQMSEAAYILEDQRRLFLLNRLDSPTSGLILLCMDRATTQQIQVLFQRRHVHKIYHAIVKGKFPNKNLFWQDNLEIFKEKHYVRVQCSDKICSNNDGYFYQKKMSKTQARLLQTLHGPNETLSWIELKPLTGRTHQLRVQCATHHFPILGDKIYGNFAWNRRWKASRLYLHAHAISFDLPHFHFEATCEPSFILF